MRHKRCRLGCIEGCFPEAVLPQRRFFPWCWTTRGRCTSALGSSHPNGSTHSKEAAAQSCCLKKPVVRKADMLPVNDFKRVCILVRQIMHYYFTKYINIVLVNI